MVITTTTLVENIRGFQTCNYSSIGALTFTLHDIVTSGEGEIRQIWRKPWTYLKLLYILIRVSSFAAQVIAISMTLRLIGSTPSPARCRVLVGLQGLSSQFLTLAVQIILVLRGIVTTSSSEIIRLRYLCGEVQALYYQNRCLVYIIRCLFVAEVVIMTTIFILALPRVQYGVYCVTISFPSIASGFFITPMLLEFLLFVLTMMKFYVAVRDKWGEENIVTRFLRDGIWAFALPFTCLCVNTLFMDRLSGSLSSVAWSWSIAVPGFAGCRLIRNLSHLLEASHRSNETGGVNVMDTIILTDISTTPGPGHNP